MTVTWRGWRFPKLHGGAPALDFVNTVDPRVGPQTEEFLVSPAALAAWAEYAGLVRGVRMTPAGFRRALELREALYRVFVALAHGRPAPAADLEVVHAAYIATLRSARVTRDGDGYRLRVPVARGADAILWPILESALALLAEPERIKECPGDDCGWVFLDATRSGTRRWCAMSSCGSREKMRRYRARVRS
jgi:predicted RNA-binding Zn ribbon-like protein